MQTMVARKKMRFKGVTLWPGDEFEAPDKKARVLKALGRAKYAEPKAPTYSRRDMRAETPTELVSLRKEYEDLVGKRPFYGWAVDKLREKIAEHREPDPEPEPVELSADDAE